MIGEGRIRWGAALCVALLLSACAVDDRQHYRMLVDDWKARGMFRTATAPGDAPFTNADLARNFVEIALHSEYEDNGLTETRIASALTRWEIPVRYLMVGSEATAADRTAMRMLARRIRNLTSLDIAEAEKLEDVNFFVFLLNEKERGGYLDKFGAKLGEEQIAFQRQWAEKREYPCVGQYYAGEGDDRKISFAIVLIKAELGPLFRKSCIHEEVAQIMGLPNDNDAVRPSLFNDDEEFALLTHHDEFLLRILYDQRLRTGMTAGEVKPLLPAIISDIRPDGKSRCCG